MQENARHTPEAVERFLDSTLESVDSAEELAVGMAQRAGMDEDDLMKIGMAIRESVVNAVVHGNRYNAHKKVRFRFRFHPRPARSRKPDAHVGTGHFSHPVFHGRFPDAAPGVRGDRGNFGKEFGV
jgi:two-component sensor histidine kinase